MKIEERGSVCFELLRKFPKKFVMRGGYATSAFEFPRFSVDLDLVVRGKDHSEFEKVLADEGLRPVLETDEFSEFYEGRFIRFEKKVNGFPVSVDFLFAMVQGEGTSVQGELTCWNPGRSG